LLSIDALTPIEDVVVEDDPQIIPGLLPKQGKVLITGETHSGKSLIALEIAHAAITGQPLWDEIEVASPVKRVLYILAEHYIKSLVELWNRTQRKVPMKTLWTVGPDKFPNHHFVVAGLHKQDNIYQVKKWVQDGQFDMVILDPLSAFFSGANASNDESTVRGAFECIDMILQPTGGTCLMLGHMGKPVLIDGVFRHRKKGATSGSMAYENAATAVFYLTQFDKNFRLECIKYKGLIPPAYTLIRDGDDDPTKPLKHRLLITDEIERKRRSVRTKFQELKNDFPNMGDTELEKILMRMFDIKKIDTVRGYLNETS
jgi:RecA-family ATPase